MWTDALKGEGPLLLLLDFDGTLVPIADHPDAIVVPARLPGLLRALRGAGHEVWIVTGRRADFVRSRVGEDVPVVGLHGLDWPGAAAPPRHGALDALKARAEEEIASEPGLLGALIEDKGLSLALHYRGADERALAHQRLLALANEVTQEHDGLGVLEGHFVVEVRPKEASKAHAVRRLVEEHPARRPVYVGDDLTDEEAFLALGDRGIGVRVSEHDVDTHASVLVSDVDEVLRGLASLS